MRGFSNYPKKSGHLPRLRCADATCSQTHPYMDHLVKQWLRYSYFTLTLRLLMSYIYMEHLFLMFLDHTQRCTTVGRTPWTSDQLVAETSTWQQTYDTHNRQISMPPVGFEPKISAGQRPQAAHLSGRGLCDKLITRPGSPTDCAASLCVI